MGKKRRQDSAATPAPKRKQRKNPPTTSESPVSESPTTSEPTSVPVVPLIGEFAALRLKEYDDEVPQIAKVVSIDELEVNIEWWIGGWTKTWNQWKTKGQVNTATVHKNAIIMAPFAFTKSNRLPREVCDKLRKLYDDIEFM